MFVMLLLVVSGVYLCKDMCEGYEDKKFFWCVIFICVVFVLLTGFLVVSDGIGLLNEWMIKWF